MNAVFSKTSEMDRFCGSLATRRIGGETPEALGGGSRRVTMFLSPPAGVGPGTGMCLRVPIAEAISETAKATSPM